MRTAFVGLGIMGRAMASNLLAAGHEVAVHNRSHGPAEALEARGARASTSPADAARHAEVVFTCLTDGAVVEAALTGPEGVLAGVAPGTVLVDHSTIDPATVARIADRARAVGCELLDAPVSGGDRGAVEGTLSIMVGGDEEAFRRVRPLLEVLGRTIARVGPSGSGQRVKAANQLLVGGTYALVSEALLLLEDGSVDVDQALAVLMGGLAGSRILEVKGQQMRDRRFEPGARVSLQRKDLAIARQLAEQQGVAIPVTAVVEQLYRALASRGGADLDHSAVLLVLEDLAGRRAPGAAPATST
jgi:2-hydroxy-3-oxopropionate reductase